MTHKTRQPTRVKRGRRYFIKLGAVMVAPAAPLAPRSSSFLPSAACFAVEKPSRQVHLTYNKLTVSSLVGAVVTVTLGSKKAKVL